MSTFIHLLNKHLLPTYYLTSTTFVPNTKKINDKAQAIIEDANAKAASIVADAYSDAKSAKEKAETYNNGMINAVTNILPVLDTLEMALNAPCSDENYKKGIELTLTTAKTALSNMGITEIAPALK